MVIYINIGMFLLVLVLILTQHEFIPEYLLDGPTRAQLILKLNDCVWVKKDRREAGIIRNAYCVDGDCFYSVDIKYRGIVVINEIALERVDCSNIDLPTDKR